MTENRSWPRVSLITPSYNQVQFLRDTIRSVLSQDYPDLEYIVIDGGSSDGSQRVIQEFEGHLAHWESEPDEGQAHAINKGWSRATGEYLWWLNSDDMLTPRSLHATVKFLQEHQDFDLVFGDIIRIDAKGQPYGVWRYTQFDLEAFIAGGINATQPGGLMRRSALEKVGPLDTSFQFSMDSEYWLRLATSGGRIAHVPKEVARFRVHPAAKSQAGSAQAVKERYRLARRVEGGQGIEIAISSLVRRKMWGSMHLECGRVWAYVGEFAPAAKELRMALAARPGMLFQSQTWALAAVVLMGMAVGAENTTRLRHILRRFRRKIGYFGRWDRAS